MKIHLTTELCEYRSSLGFTTSTSRRWNLAQEFMESYPEVKLLVEGDKRPKRYITNQQDLDIFRGFLMAKGGTNKTTPTLPALPNSAQGKSLVASLVRDVKQLRSLGYDVKVSVREPSKEL